MASAVWGAPVDGRGAGRHRASRPRHRAEGGNSRLSRIVRPWSGRGRSLCPRSQSGTGTRRRRGGRASGSRHASGRAVRGRLFLPGARRRPPTWVRTARRVRRGTSPVTGPATTHVMGVTSGVASVALVRVRREPDGADSTVQSSTAWRRPGRGASKTPNVYRCPSTRRKKRSHVPAEEALTSGEHSRQRDLAYGSDAERARRKPAQAGEYPHPVDQFLVGQHLPDPLGGSRLLTERTKRNGAEDRNGAPLSASGYRWPGHRSPPVAAVLPRI